MRGIKRFFLLLVLMAAVAPGIGAQDRRDIRGTVHLGAPPISEEQWKRLEKATRDMELFSKELQAISEVAPPIMEVTASGPGVSRSVLTAPDGSYVLGDLPPQVYVVSARTSAQALREGKPNLVSGSYPVRAVESRGFASPSVFPELVSIRGVVTDAEGKPIAGARVIGSPIPYPEVSEILMVEDALTTTGADGSYVLRGFPPVASPYRLAGYLSGGSLQTDTDFGTCVDISVEAPDFEKKTQQVPLVSERYLADARRMLGLLKRLAESAERKPEHDFSEKPGVGLPESKGSAIIGINFIMQREKP